MKIFGNSSNFWSNSSPSSTVQSKLDKELTLFSPYHKNNNKNPHQNLPVRYAAGQWKADRFNLEKRQPICKSLNYWK